MQKELRGWGDAFITKINADGKNLVYSTYIGGSGGTGGGCSAECGSDIVVDAYENVYVVGHTDSSDFPIVSAIQNSIGGEQDIFVTKIAATGSNFIYSTYLGGNNYDMGFSIAVDTSGNAYVTGYTGSVDFPTVSPIQGAYAGDGDAFIVKIGEQVLPSTPTQSQGQGFGANNQGTNNAPGLKKAAGVETAPGLKK